MEGRLSSPFPAYPASLLLAPHTTALCLVGIPLGSPLRGRGQYPASSMDTLHMPQKFWPLLDNLKPGLDSHL